MPLKTSQQLGIHINHAETRVSRWTHAFTQYRPHHAERVAAIDGLLPRRLQLAGSSYRAIGIPACIADGTAAEKLLDRWQTKRNARRCALLVQ